MNIENCYDIFIPNNGREYAVMKITNNDNENLWRHKKQLTTKVYFKNDDDIWEENNECGYISADFSGEGFENPNMIRHYDDKMQLTAIAKSNIYKFYKWQQDKNGVIDYNDSITRKMTIVEDTFLSALFIYNLITITYKSSDPDMSYVETVIANSEYKIKDCVDLGWENTNYKISYWIDQDGNQREIHETIYSIQEDIVLRANWVLTGIEITGPKTKTITLYPGTYKMTIIGGGGGGAWSDSGLDDDVWHAGGGGAGARIIVSVPITETTDVKLYAGNAGSNVGGTDQYHLYKGGEGGSSNVQINNITISLATGGEGGQAMDTEDCKTYGGGAGGIFTFKKEYCTKIDGENGSSGESNPESVKVNGGTNGDTSRYGWGGGFENTKSYIPAGAGYIKVEDYVN